jgi:hypothetical protein
MNRHQHQRATRAAYLALHPRATIDAIGEWEIARKAA